MLTGGLRPPDPLTRSLAGTPTPRSARVAHSLRSFAPLTLTGGLRPPASLTRSLAGTPTPRSARVAHSLRSFAPLTLTGGLRPPASLTRSLAGTPTPRSARVAHSLRSFAPLTLTGGLRPPDLPYTLARGDPDAPLRSRGSLAPLVRATNLNRGTSSPAPLTRSLAGTPTPRSARVAHSLRSFAPLMR